MQMTKAEKLKVLKLWRTMGWDIPDTKNKSADEITTMYRYWEETINYNRRNNSQFNLRSD